MPDAGPKPCPQHALIEALARGELEDARRREAERILEQSEPCRELFRQLTAGRYPRLPQYTIIGQVGRGGFGVVYKAIHHAKERTEALKVLFSKTPLLTSYFENEVHLIARLQHPNIATLYDAQLATPPLYYTMEFVEGQRLNDYLKQHKVSLATRIDLIKSVALAVHYAHGEGVVHRDLKPQNILIDGGGRPHIVDFGIAKKLAEVRTSDETDDPRKGREGPVGTLGYIAPEQEKGDTVDGRADVFALGALLFHSVTGDPARLAKLEDQRLKILRERQVAQPEDLSAIIGRCVEDSPDARYATCEEFAADLDSYVTGRPIRARDTASFGYHASRVLALVLRDAVLAVRVSIVILVAGMLTWLFWAVKVYSVGAPQGGDRTVMVGLTEQTLEAIDDGEIDLPGLTSWNTRSWRLLYGRVMERLAPAKPSVVVLDAWMPRCTEFDDAFIRGVHALEAPVIVGAVKFDVNGEPDMCPAIRAVVHGYGAVFGAAVDAFPNEYEVAYCIQRGFADPIPGLAIAAFAAARFPNREAKLRLDTDKLKLEIRYRVPNPKPGEYEWEKHSNTVQFHRVLTAERDHGPFAEYVRAGRMFENDKSIRGRVRARSNAYWQDANRTLSIDRVLAADDKQLHAWFNGRAVILGLMVPGGKDEYTRPNGERVFGCQVQAEAIDALLARIPQYRLTKRQLTLRNIIWCGMAALLVSVHTGRKWRSLRWVTLWCAVAFFGGVMVGCHLASRTATPWVLELVIALTGLIAAGSLTFWARAARDRMLELSPSGVTPAQSESTLASTMLAETR